MATKDDVLKIAALARIEIREDEVEAIKVKLSSVLQHFTFLEEAQTSGVEPLFHGIDQMEFREDQPEPALDRKELLQNAPDQLDDSFRIPKVVGAVE